MSALPAQIAIEGITESYAVISCHFAAADVAVFVMGAGACARPHCIG